MDNITISVIIPAYNSESTVVDSLKSVLSQSAIDKIVEIIVVDDGSTDNTVEIIENYIADTHNDSMIKIITQNNSGAASARNLGMSRAVGNWIALLDSDDVWLPNKIEKQLYVLSQFPDADFIGTGSNYGTSIICGEKKSIDCIYKGNLKSFCLKYYPVTPSALFKKSIVCSLGGFDENMRYGEDGEFFSRILSSYNYYYLAENLVDCGHGKKSFGDKGLSSNLKKMYESNIEIIKRLRKRNKIGLAFYLFLRFFYKLKNIRRIMMTN